MRQGALQNSEIRGWSSLGRKGQTGTRSLRKRLRVHFSFANIKNGREEVNKIKIGELYLFYHL